LLEDCLVLELKLVEGALGASSDRLAVSPTPIATKARPVGGGPSNYFFPESNFRSPSMVLQPSFES